MKKKLIILSGFVLSLSPVIVFAEEIVLCSVGKGTDTVTTLYALFCRLGQIFSAVLPVFIALAVVIFVWGVVMYVIASDEEAKKKGKDKIIYGIIGLVVIISLWGFVSILINTFNLTPNATIDLPAFDF